MKSIIGFVVFVCLSVSAFGTVETRTYYHHEHFELTFIHNHNYYYVKDHLYYKGIAVVLNDYVGQLKKQGKLSKGPVRIEVGGMVFGGLPSVRMTRSSRGYRAFFHSKPRLAYLMQVVNYFASDKWESFCYKLNEVDDDAAKRTFDKKMFTVVGPAASLHIKQKVLVYDVDEIQVYLENNELCTYLSGTKLDVTLGQIYPFKMKDRYFVNHDHEIRVYEAGKLILTFPLTNKFYSDWETGYEVELKSKWANIVQYGNDIMSYSYERNRFYRVLR